MVNEFKEPPEGALTGDDSFMKPDLLKKVTSW